MLQNVTLLLHYTINFHYFSVMDIKAVVSGLNTTLSQVSIDMDHLKPIKKIWHSIFVATSILK